MKIDKIQEAYNKMLSEKKFQYMSKYMGKANDIMADFLEELENSSTSKRFDDRGKDLIKEFKVIDEDWENLWDKIVSLTRKL